MASDAAKHTVDRIGEDLAHMDPGQGFNIGYIQSSLAQLTMECLDAEDGLGDDACDTYSELSDADLRRLIHRAGCAKEPSEDLDRDELDDIYSSLAYDASYESALFRNYQKIPLLPVPYAVVLEAMSSLRVPEHSVVMPGTPRTRLSSDAFLAAVDAAKSLGEAHRVCHNPSCPLLAKGEKDVTLKRCSRCKTVSYCSVECQKSHFPRHKNQCNKASP